MAETRERDREPKRRVQGGARVVLKQDEAGVGGAADGAVDAASLCLGSFGVCVCAAGLVAQPGLGHYRRLLSPEGRLGPAKQPETTRRHQREEKERDKLHQSEPIEELV